MRHFTALWPPPGGLGKLLSDRAEALRSEAPLDSSGSNLISKLGFLGESPARRDVPSFGISVDSCEPGANSGGRKGVRIPAAEYMAYLATDRVVHAKILIFNALQ